MHELFYENMEKCLKIFDTFLDLTLLTGLYSSRPTKYFDRMVNFITESEKDMLCSEKKIMVHNSPYQSCICIHLKRFKFSILLEFLFERSDFFSVGEIYHKFGRTSRKHYMCVLYVHVLSVRLSKYPCHSSEY